MRLFEEFEENYLSARISMYVFSLKIIGRSVGAVVAYSLQSENKSGTDIKYTGNLHSLSF